MKDHLREERERAAARKLGEASVLWTLFRTPILVLAGLGVAVLAVWRFGGSVDLPSRRSAVLVLAIVVLLAILVLLVPVLFRGRGPRPPRMPRGF